VNSSRVGIVVTGTMRYRLPAVGALIISVLAFPANAQSSVQSKVIAAAIEQTRHEVRYEPRYVKIPYPGGDVPANTGVCSDVVIRAYRSAGIDLQKEVHEDMAAHFSAYPKQWGLTTPDSNIDHRRVPNLMTYFRRKGAALPVTRTGRDYLPGDLVTWNLTGTGVPHIGVVTDRKSADGSRPLLVHNIGEGPKLEDVLFAWSITGHFRYPAGSGPTAGGGR
jgi:uncharacterized protein